MQLLETKDNLEPEIAAPAAGPVAVSTENPPVESSNAPEKTPTSSDDHSKEIQAVASVVPTVNIGVTLREGGESALMVASSIEEGGPVLGPRSVSKTDLGAAVLQLFGEYLPILKAHLDKPRPPAPSIQQSSPAVKSSRPQSKKAPSTPKAPPSFVGSSHQQAGSAVTQGAFSF